MFGEHTAVLSPQPFLLLIICSRCAFLCKFLSEEVVPNKLRAKNCSVGFVWK